MSLLMMSSVCNSDEADFHSLDTKLCSIAKQAAEHIHCNELVEYYKVKYGVFIKSNIIDVIAIHDTEDKSPMQIDMRSGWCMTDLGSGSRWTHLLLALTLDCDIYFDQSQSTVTRYYMVKISQLDTYYGNYSFVDANCLRHQDGYCDLWSVTQCYFMWRLPFLPLLRTIIDVASCPKHTYSKYVFTCPLKPALQAWKYLFTYLYL